MIVRGGLVGSGAIVGMGLARNESHRVREAQIPAFGRVTCVLRRKVLRRKGTSPPPPFLLSCLGRAGRCARRIEASEASRWGGGGLRKSETGSAGKRGCTAIERRVDRVHIVHIVHIGGRVPVHSSMSRVEGFNKKRKVTTLVYFTYKNDCCYVRRSGVFF